MTHPNEYNTPEARQRATVRIRRLTRTAVLAAAGATALIGVFVAKEHPGASSADRATGTNPTTSSTNTTTSTSTTTGTSSGSGTSSTTTHPTTTTTQPVVTSGGTSR
jgi:cytoskeletal protein RodZ